MDAVSLDGKVAVVTGAGAGLGRAEALALAAAGADVVVNDLPGGPGGGVVDEIEALGGKAVLVEGDVSERATADALTLAALDRGGLDIVVNNAGLLRDKMLFSMSDDDWDLVLKVHLRGHFLLSRNASAHWRTESKAKGGPVYARVVNTASEAFLVGSAGQANYAAAKAGIVALTLATARGLERYGVRANAICPRARTAMTAEVFGEAPDDGLDPLSPEQVAPLVVYLASPAAQTVSGQVFVVHGGMVALLAAPAVERRFDADRWTPATLADQVGGYFAERDPMLSFAANDILKLGSGGAVTLSLLSHVGRLPDQGILIDGQWRPAADGASWTHTHPATGEAIGSFPVATESDVDKAVHAARTAFDDGPWPRSRAGQRVKLLHRYADLLRANADDLRRLQALDNGVPLSFAGIYATSVEAAADVFEHHAGWIDKVGGETLPPYQGGDHLAMTFREPIGVVAAILPWNAPFLLYAQKVAPALAAGCTVVLKPSEFATFTVLRMVELLVEAGLPHGVLNVVTGPGNPTGEALVTHPLVDKVSFTGSRAVGRHIIEASAGTLKRVSLELGGKSPTLVFPDAPDVGLAAMTTMGTVTMGLSGQACVAHTRALVHRDVYDDFLNAAQLLAGMITYGDPFDPAVLSAPLINAKQLDRVLGYIERGKDSGARLVAGGSRVDGALADGNFVQPTIFADVDNTAELAQEEIFGPVLAVVPFGDEDEAIRLANATRYGLGAGVYTTDNRRAFRVARALRAGTVGINGFQVEPHLPFGGFKQSGLGREGGRSAFEAYTELKTVLMPLTDELM